MKKVLVVLIMLIIAMGLVGCPPRYYDRDRHDHDRGHDYEHRDRDRDDREHRRQRGVTNEKNKNEKTGMIRSSPEK